MMNHVSPILCILLAVGHLSRSTGKLVLNVVPNTISPGVTPELTVNCSFTYNNQPNISTIMSLIISKAESHNREPGVFSDVISINAFANQVIGADNTNAVASGNIDSHTLDAFLSLSWSSPSQAESGFYRCDANVLDDFGHPVDLSTSAEVTSGKPDLDRLIEIVGSLEADLALVNQELGYQVQINNNQQSTIVTLNSTVTALTSNIAVLQQDFEDQAKSKANQTNDLKTDNVQQELMFTAKSHTFDRHVYLLPEIQVKNIHMAEYLCNTTHGYLAEIEDDPELKFIQNFLSAQSWKPDYMLGATRVGQSDQWVFRHSGRNATFFNWGAFEPGSGNCTYLEANVWSMGTLDCDLLYKPRSFICEVPEN